MKRTMLALALALALAVAGPAASQGKDPPAWSEPIAPFRVIGPITYVGTRGLAAYLIRTREGAILIDGTLPENAGAIERNIAALGVPLTRVKLLLNSHAHFDHAGGLAALKRATGARLLAMGAERRALESGKPAGENLSGAVDFPAVEVDRIVRDGEVVRLGDVALTAISTPGHTPGCTTWLMRVADRGRNLRVIFPCSLSVAGNRLFGNRGYPGIVADYRRSFARLDAVRADVVLTAHPEFADVLGRHARAAKGERDAYVDRAMLPRQVREAREAFEAELVRQQRK